MFTAAGVRIWRVDETYVKLNGKWVYLYKAADKFGDTIDFSLCAKRDTAASKPFFRKAFREDGQLDKINIDKGGTNSAALEIFNKDLSQQERIEVKHNKYLRNLIKQDHGFIKKRT